jgi:hypothetical protein
MRHPPNRYTLVGCIPVRYILIFENGFVVLDAEPGLAGVSGLASAILCESGNSNFSSASGTKLLDGVLASCKTELCTRHKLANSSFDGRTQPQIAVERFAVLDLRWSLPNPRLHRN